MNESQTYLGKLLADFCKLGHALCTNLGELSLCSLQFCLHALVLCQVHLPILLLQLLRALLPLLSTLCRLQKGPRDMGFSGLVLWLPLPYQGCAFMHAQPAAPAYWTYDPAAVVSCSSGDGSGAYHPDLFTLRLNFSSELADVVPQGL